METLEKLDTILTVLCVDKRVKPQALEGEILASIYDVTTFEEIPAAEVLKILEKLKNDGFVGIETVPILPYSLNLTENRYYTTIEGDMFYYQGGYRAKFASVNAEKAKAETEDARQRYLSDQALQNAKSLNRLTALLVIGTTIAAIYYLSEIIKPYKHDFISVWMLVFLIVASILMGVTVWLIILELAKQYKNDK